MDPVPRTGRSTPWDLGVGDRDQPAGRIFAILLENHLIELGVHVEAVRRDDDAEALHDYRVVLRRSRSLLHAGEPVFPAEERTLLLAMIAQLSTTTSPVRDLDIVLADLHDRCVEAPEQLRDAEDALATMLLARRSGARAQLDTLLDGEFHAVMLRRWRRLASVHRLGGGEPGPEAHRPADEVVAEALRASHRRLRRRGRRAVRSMEPADWHSVRRSAKRLRYQIRAVSPLYPPDVFRKVNRRLAMLQDGLGQMQDEVARSDLLAAAGLEVGGRAALLAGALVGAVDHDAADMLGRCASVWDRFDRPGTRRRLHDALDPD